MLLMDFLGIHEAIRALFLIIDGSLYNLICGFYKVFLALANLNLFSNEDYEGIVRRVYIVLGIIMLFVLSYSLLRAIINPDEYSKGEKSFPNLIKNVLISLVIIVLLPTIFDVAFRVQGAILNQDVIGRIILNENVGQGSIKNGGSTIAANVFKAFFYVNEDSSTGDHSAQYNELSWAVDGAFDEVGRGGSFLIFASREYDAYADGTYVSTVNFPKSVADNAISHSWPWSTVAGVFVLWCILLFCFDLGVRAIKLIYYQMIGPIAAACRVIPGNKTKDIFPNWVKLTFATFMEVFVRIFIMYIGVYLITLLVEKFPDINAAGVDMDLNWLQIFLLRAFLIMGIVAFIRQAPKLIQDVFGFDTGGMSLGVKGLFERLGNGGAFAMGGAAIAGIGGLGKGLRHNIHNIKQAKGIRKLSAVGRMVTGIPGNFFGAGGRAFVNNWNAKNFGDAKSGVDKGVSGTLDSMTKKENYRASVRAPGLFGTTRGRIKAGAKGAAAFVGFGDDFERLQNQQKLYNEANALSSVKDIVTDDPVVMAAIKEKEEAAKRDNQHYMKNMRMRMINGQNIAVDRVTGQAIQDASGNVFGSLEAAARFRRTQDVEMADNILKLTQQLALHEKFAKGDGRVIAAINKTNRLINENRGDTNMTQLGTVRDLSAQEISMIQQALNSGNASMIDKALDTLGKTQGTMLFTDKAMKAAGGDVTVKLANLREKQQGKGS